MTSNHEQFWSAERYAVVGHSASKPFPKLTYNALKKAGRTVFAVDPEADTIEGDPAWHTLDALPESVDAVVIEVPKEESAAWVAQAVRLGLKDVWLHMNADSDEAKALAKEAGINLRTGTCAVMYLTQGVSIHGFHRWIRKRKGLY